MVLLKSSPENEALAQLDDKAKESMDHMRDYIQDLAKAGVFVAAEGLHPSKDGARIVFTKEGKKVIDGPFAEAKELIAGYWILECKSLEECIEWAKRAPLYTDSTYSDGVAQLEIRQIWGEEDFDQEFNAALNEHEAETARLMEESAASAH